MHKSQWSLTSNGLLWSRRGVFSGVLLVSALTAGLTLPAAGQLKLPSLPAPSQVTQPEDKLVEIELASQFDPVTPGEQFSLAVVLKVSDGWHLYANPKQGEFGIETEITPQPAAALRFGSSEYPPGELYVDKALPASNHIYEGTVICYVPVEVQADAAGQVTAAFEITGQLCSDAGVCRRWKAQAQTTVNIVPSVDAATRTANRPELFTGSPPSQAVAQSTGWLMAILLALGAGLVMNLMPCVLPIIPIIIMTLMKQCAPEEGAPPDRAKSIKIGLAFAAGILVVFAGLAVVMSVFKLLWGQQFQGIGFKFALLMIVYVLSLSMFGLFEIVLPSSIANVSVVRKGYLGALGMGMLATILATPCGAPLLTGVLAWSLSRPLAVTIAVFLVIGAGMAAPYILLTAFPQLLGRVPRGGNWMIRLKQVIGFAMLGFAAYLITLFPAAWFGPLLYFCLLVGFSVWLGWHVVNLTTPTGKRYAFRLVAILLIVVASVLLAQTPKAGAAGTDDWQGRLETFQQQGKTVIVKFTANWCKNCSTLDKLIYKRDVFTDRLAATGAELVIADWSDPEPKINDMLRKYDQQSLPFAAVFPAADPKNPILLRDFYSLDDTLKALDEAAKR